MSTNIRFNTMRLVLTGIFLITICCSCATDTSNGAKSADSQVAKATSSSHSSNATSPKPAVKVMAVPYYPPPATLDFCGEPVPLNDQEVLERFDREFTVIVYNHAQVYLWLKRMERYFPWIEERLRSHNLPDDLKYVAIAESDLLPNACSPKGAAGPWQFMPSTGSAYGLNQRGTCDERYDFELATECAFRYMNDLYKRYRNWTLSIATYNCGDKRILEQCRLQGTSDYYKLKLPTETERYILRILAIKEVLGNPIRYGYNLPEGQGYPEFKVDMVNVSLTCPLPIQDAAQAAGASYRELKRLNPVFRGEEIPAGTHQIKVPQGRGKDFEKSIDSAKPAKAESSSYQERSKEEGSTPAVAREKPASPKASVKSSKTDSTVKSAKAPKSKPAAEKATAAKVVQKSSAKEGRNRKETAKKAKSKR